MKIEESADGTVKVVELDPTKWQWIILDSESGINPRDIQHRDGVIIVKPASAKITFVENTEKVKLAHEMPQTRGEEIII